MNPEQITLEQASMMQPTAETPTPEAMQADGAMEYQQSAPQQETAGQSRAELVDQAAAASPRTFQSNLMGFLYDQRQAQQETARVAAGAAVGVQQVEQRLTQVTAQVGQLAAADVQACDAQYFAERDHRRVLISGERFVQHFQEVGQQGIRVVLVEWAQAFKAQVDTAARDWSAEAGQCLVFLISFPGGGKRVVVDLPTKLCRDELCSQWGRSPSRLAQWSDTTVRARLTVTQEGNRKRVLAAFQEGNEEGTMRYDLAWKFGRRVFFQADVAVVLTTGQPVFRIPLGLHASTVEGLIHKALALAPTGPMAPTPGRQPPPSQQLPVPFPPPPPPPAPEGGVRPQQPTQPPSPRPDAMGSKRQKVGESSGQPTEAVMSEWRGRAARRRRPGGRSRPDQRCAVVAWNCNGYTQDKIGALQTAIEQAPNVPAAVVLVETHRQLPTVVCPGYTTSSALQNTADWIPSGAAHRRATYFGGVAIAVRRPDCSVLDSESALCYVTAVIRVAGVGTFIVVGVYIPPRSSRHLSAKYADVVDSIAESIARMQLRHNVPSTQVMMVGDWNAHLGSSPCGVVVDDEEGDFGGPRGDRWYYGLRQSQCQASVHAARGAALDRACQRHCWLVLNGRCRSDSSGRATNSHQGRWSVIDLVVVPREARGDMSVITVRDNTQGHRAIYAEVVLRVEAGATCTSEGASTRERPILVKLSTEQVRVFRTSAWARLAGRVIAARRDAGEGRGASEAALAAFEDGILGFLSEATQRPVARLQGQRRRWSSQAAAPEQPWYTGECVAAKAAWKLTVTQREPREVVQAAKRRYRATCRRARRAFVWDLEQFRLSHVQQFWDFLRVRIPPPVPTLEAFRSHFEQLFGGEAERELPPEWAAVVDQAFVPVFTVDEVRDALAQMARGKSAGNAVFSLDYFRDCPEIVYTLVANLFTGFARQGYPRKLNTLLFMPLYKFKGDRELCDNYRGIALIHPLGRWFSKCVERRLANDPRATRAECQAGFRPGARLEDHALLLQTMYQLASTDRSPLFSVFVDLRKAYDSVDRSRLYQAFVDELGITPYLVGILRKMYTDVRAQVLVDGTLATPFAIEQGVLQGCPASPLIFSLFMDRLEEFLGEQMGEWTASEVESVRAAGLLVPLLLFADDIVLSSRSQVTLQRLLDALASFCQVNGMTVNLAKTKWLVGGQVPRRQDAIVQMLYRGERIERVSGFKYLGLQFDGSVGMGAMTTARLTAANKAWGKLMGLLTALGWRDRATRLLLFDTFVRSSLLFGGPVWGMQFLRAHGDIAVDTTGAFGVFYRRALRSLLGVTSSLRNALVYILSGRPPLQILLGKQVCRYIASLRDSDRLIAEAFRWVQTVDSQAQTARLSLCAAASFVQAYPHISQLYVEMRAQLKKELATSGRIAGREMQGVWEDLVDIAFGGSTRRLSLPGQFESPRALRAVCPRFRFVTRRAKTVKLYAPPKPSWLQLPDRELHRLVGYLYEEVGQISIAEEKDRLACLGDSALARWDAQQQALAVMVHRNGLAMCLWCCASSLLGMMDSLWQIE